MKKFSSLNIFGIETPLYYENLSETPYDGYYCPVNKHIVINKDVDNLYRTVVHEIIHSIWDRTGITQTKIPLEVQEILAENISVALDENYEQTHLLRKIRGRHKKR